MLEILHKGIIYPFLMPTKLYQFEKTDAGATQKSPRHPIQAIVKISKKDQSTLLRLHLRYNFGG